MFNIKSFLGQCGRVWRILKKPDGSEYKTTAKVAAIGLVLIGLIGFAISVFMNLFSLG
jgi:protein translocase SEC61 complex gamma subunit